MVRQNSRINIDISNQAERILYIVAGCNGAGKTTAFKKMLSKKLKNPPFVNPDEIAREICPENVESVAIRAGKLAIEQRDKYLNAGISFCVETTLATRTYANLVKKAHEKRYKVALFYYWLDSPELAVYRVAERVKEGGHNVPESDIRNRYKLSIDYLMKKYIPIVDYWRITDNSFFSPQEIACGGVNVYNEKLFEALKNNGK